MKIQIICPIFAACLFALPAVFCSGFRPIFHSIRVFQMGFHAQKVELKGSSSSTADEMV